MKTPSVESKTNQELFAGERRSNIPCPDLHGIPAWTQSCGNTVLKFDLFFVKNCLTIGGLVGLGDFW